MKLLQLVREDRRIGVLLLAGLLAIILGFVVVPPGAALQVMTKGGYWIMLGTFAWFVWSLFRLLREDRPWAAWRNDFPPGILLLLLGCGALLLVHERFGFKILMDEIMLLGTSMGMHFDKQAYVPVRAHDLQGAFQLLDGQLDKRPLLHPFLVSVLHDLTGYRPENVFVLNAGLAFGLLFLVYAVVRRLAGMMGAVLAVLLLSSLPLLAQSATGGGFDLLNLVMITLTLALAVRYFIRPDRPSQQAMLLSAVLLSQTRYESVLFLIPVGIMLGWVWWRQGRPLLSWETVFVPLLFVPVALHQKIFSARESAWELASQPGFDRPFSLGYAAVNLPHWLNFFFDTTGEHSNAIVLSVLGFVALPFLLLWCWRTMGAARTTGPTIPVAHAIFATGFAAHTLLMLFYFWGRFDDPVIRRLSLPLDLWLVLAVVTVATQFARFKWVWPVLLGLTGVGYFSFSLPAMARHDYSLDYYVGRETEWRREFMRAHPEKDYLFIDPEALIWITHKVSATPVRQALERKDILEFNFRNHTFTAFYVFQRYQVDPDTGHLAVQPDYDLGPDYQIETVWERRFTPMTVSRISRVVAVKGGPTTMPVAPAKAGTLTPEQREKIRQEYFDNLIRRLP